MDACSYALPCGRATLIDADCIGLLDKWTWQAIKAKSGAYYVRCGPCGSLARWLMNAPKGQHVDHINGDSLDNRRCNLRVCTHAQNQWNRKRSPGVSRYKGVTYFRANNPESQWVARITKHANRRYLGAFPTQLQAALAYDDAARALHGEYAGVNFPERFNAMGTV